MARGNVGQMQNCMLKTSKTTNSNLFLISVVWITLLAGKTPNEMLFHYVMKNLCTLFKV